MRIRDIVIATRHHACGALRVCGGRLSKVSIALGCASLTCLLADSADALNGLTYMNVCSCATTADFVGAATTAALQQQKSGIYILVSRTLPRTAAIYVAVRVVGHGNGYIVTSTTPVDAAGNSLAGEAEATLEAYYGTYDQVTFGTNRDHPVFALQAAYFPSSFINSTDVEMSSAIDEWLSANGITVGYPATVTITFNDGTSAEFTAQQKGLPWVWTGIAHNKNGQLINRNGTLRSNPNQTGSSAGGGTIPGLGSGGDWSWSGVPGALCTIGVSVQIPDDGNYEIGSYQTPC